MDPADGNERAGCAAHTPSWLASAYSEAIAEPSRTDLYPPHAADHAPHSREASAVRFVAAAPASPMPFPARARIFVECSPARSGRTAATFDQVSTAAEFAVATQAAEGVRPDAYPGARGFRHRAGSCCFGWWAGEARHLACCCGPRPEPDGSLETPRVQAHLQHYGARRCVSRPIVPRDRHGVAERSGSGKLRVHPDVGRIRDARD